MQLDVDLDFWHGITLDFFVYFDVDSDGDSDADLSVDFSWNHLDFMGLTWVEV